MMSPVYGTATATAFDANGTPVQMAYPAGAIYPTAMPFAAPDLRGAFEVIPHRIFVGGFPSATTELELRTYFEQYGHIREAKVIRSNEGASKGYGFITFDSEEEAKSVMSMISSPEKLEFKGRRLNLGPAIRRVTHGSRFAQEYAIATPTGQLLAASPVAGYTYAYPQSPYMLISSTQIPQFIYSPISPVASPVVPQDGGDCKAQNAPAAESTPVKLSYAQQMVTLANSTPLPSPKSNSSTSPQQQPATVQSTPVPLPQQYYHPSMGLQHTTQPLTPMTPTSLRSAAAFYPQATPYYAASSTPAASDMTHYSQMGVQQYFYAPSTYQTVDMNGQLTMSAPFYPSAVPAQQYIYDDSQQNGWPNPSDQPSTASRSNSSSSERYTIRPPWPPRTYHQHSGYRGFRAVQPSVTCDPATSQFPLTYRSRNSNVVSAYFNRQLYGRRGYIDPRWTHQTKPSLMSLTANGEASQAVVDCKTTMSSDRSTGVNGGRSNTKVTSSSQIEPLADNLPEVSEGGVNASEDGKPVHLLSYVSTTKTSSTAEKSVVFMKSPSRNSKTSCSGEDNEHCPIHTATVTSRRSPRKSAASLCNQMSQMSIQSLNGTQQSKAQTSSNSDQY